MKNTKTNKLLLYLISCFFFSCYSAPECVDTPSFTALEPAESTNYQAEVRKTLQNYSPEDFRYYFLTFIEEGTDTYMMTSFRNEKLCFDVKVWVNKWDKLGGMRRHNGKAYPKGISKSQMGNKRGK